MSDTAPIPKHTFSEALIIEGATYYMQQWWLDTTGDDCWKIPFYRVPGNVFIARCGKVKPTLADIRSAVVDQVLHLNDIGTKWDRRTTDSKDQEGS